jgi:predicted PhzF superfamily epimerase YddE/YHI9
MYQELLMNIYTVDAFTDNTYSGNPAGVCVLESGKPVKWMQSVAAEMNLSETAFLLKAPEGYMLRWFTPKTEVDLCGHATLASAHLLWETGLCDDDEITFHTKSGELGAKRVGRWIELDFPLEMDEETEAPGLLRESLGVPFKYVGKNRMDYIVEVEDEQTVKNLQPDFALMKLMTVRGVLVTATSDKSGFDFVSRCFFPALGIDEDPVTGSAHCCMGPYWAKKLGKRQLSARQISQRGGELRLSVLDERILIYGEAVTVIKGELAGGAE